MKYASLLPLIGLLLIGGQAFAAEPYNPAIHPLDFTMEITNPYFSIPIGKKFVYEADTEDGLERIEILIPGWTRDVMGVKTLVYWDRVYLDGELIEDTRDYLAQHKNGDVWYFGDHVDNYENGTLVDHDGSWIGGIDGALPGIWMKAHPKVGDKYRQEYYEGEAEDAAEVLATNETVTTPYGSFKGCLKIFEWSPLFPQTAHKYYCKQVGGTTLEVDLPGPTSTTEQRTELVDVRKKGALGIQLPASYAKEGVIPARSVKHRKNKKERPSCESANEEREEREEWETKHRFSEATHGYKASSASYPCRKKK